MEDIASPESRTPELQRLELERERLQHEKQLAHDRLEHERQLAQFENRFMRRHAGAVVTAGVSLAAVVVSASQVWVADIQRNQQLTSDSARHVTEMQLAEKDHTRRWLLDAATFVFNNRAAIFSSSDNERRQIRDVMLATFPAEITGPLFKQFEMSEQPERRDLWRDGQRQVADRYRRAWEDRWEMSVRGRERTYVGTLDIAVDTTGRVSGTYAAGYDNTGSIEGRLSEDGRAMTGMWKNSLGNAGRVVLHLAHDARTFTGSYSMSPNDPPDRNAMNRWNGTKDEPAARAQ